MSRLRYLPSALALVLAGSNFLPSCMLTVQAQAQAQAPAAAAPAETVRPEVGKPYQAAVDLFKAKNYKAALAKLGEITVADKTPYETYTIERAKVAIYSGMGDEAGQTEAMQAAIATGKAPAAEQSTLILAMADLSFRHQDYAQAATWLTRYLKEGGADPMAHTMLVQSYYFSNDFAHAKEALQADLAAEEAAGQTPSEDQLKFLFSIAAKQNDKAAYVAALEKAVVYYPKKEYWVDLTKRIRANPNYSDRLDLDYYRLRFALGAMTKPEEYTDMAELAMQSGLPAESKKVLDAGFQAGVLGSGPDAERQKRLQDMATKKAADDLNTIAKTEAEIRKSKDGIGYVNLGYLYVTNEQYDKGIALIRQGMGGSGLKHPEEVHLHLATAYALAGRTEDAIREFKAVQGSDGSGDLARYWVIHLTHPTS